MSVYKFDRNGKVTGWRAVVRIRGYPLLSVKKFERKQEADDWK